MVLEVDNVELSFNKEFILNGIYIKAEKGKITGILGKNGSGKSSLLKIIFGILNPQNKLIRINNQPKIKPLYLSGKIKYLSQKDILPNHVTCIQSFNIFRINWSQFELCFPTFKKYKNQKISNLSGGERRVLETYLLLKTSGEILLLDEPFSNIAPLYIETFISLLHEEKKSKIILLTDHMYRYILNISDSIYLIDNNVSRRITNHNDLIQYGYVTSL